MQNWAVNPALKTITLESACVMEVDYEDTTTELIRNSTIFNAAIKENDYSTIHNLLKGGFNLNNPFSVNCVRLATTRNNLNIIKLLVKYQADVNNSAHIDSALCVAIENGYFNIADFLITCGANIHDSNSSGLCFLHTAIQSFKCCLADAKKNRKFHAFQDHVSFMEKEYSYYKIMKCLLEKDASKINGKCCDNKTPLCSIIVGLHNSRAVLPFTKLLIKFGADVNIPSGRLTPLFYVVKFCQEELAKLLLKFGAKIDTIIYENNKMNILHYAIKQNRFSIVKQIMNYICLDINAERYYYHALPLLHYAVKKACPGILRSFLIAGGDVSQKDKNGHSLLETYMSNCANRSLKTKQCLRLIVFFLIIKTKHYGCQFSCDDLKCMYVDWYSFRYLEKIISIGLSSPISETFPVSCLQILYASDTELAKLVNKYVLNSECAQNILTKKYDLVKDVIEDLISKGKQRLEILREENVLERIANFLSPSAPLDVYCVGNIIRFLNNTDLKNLLRASKKKHFLV